MFLLENGKVDKFQSKLVRHDLLTNLILINSIRAPSSDCAFLHFMMVLFYVTINDLNAIIIIIFYLSKVCLLSLEKEYQHFFN